MHPHTESVGPQRRLALTAMVAAVAIVTLDTTILNVAIPTIARDLHSDLGSLQWVIAGYSLTLASLLIIGGRIADAVGVRRAFVVGALLFAGGSLLASMATTVPQLVAGEAIIEGVGASLLFPASLAALSMTFPGPARAKAFALWGGIGGACAALGPVIGGWLTTTYSWRWGFRINVVIAPLAAIGALAALPRATTATGRRRIDLKGAVLLASGLFLVVFALTEAPDHGWLANHGPGIAVGAATLWPKEWPLSPVISAVIMAAVLLGCFVRIERRHIQPLIDPGLFTRRSFSGGLVTAAAVVMAQAGTMFTLAVFLQTTHHLTAISAGRWLLPVGIAALIGAQAGGRLADSSSPIGVVRTGIVVEFVGVLAAAAVLSTSVTWTALAAALALFGLGAGMASSQLTNVILSEVPRERVGAASGVATTNNALGAALGVAVLGAVLRSGAVGASAARWSLLTGALVLTIGGAASLVIRQRRRQPVEAGHSSSEPVLEGTGHAA